MSSAVGQSGKDDDEDPFAEILELEEEFEKVAEREDRFGAIARYFLAVARGEAPDDYDAKLAGLPEVGGDE